MHETTGHPLIVGELAHLSEQQAVEALEEALRDVPEGLEVQRRTVEAHARDALLAASREADLLVVGARRRHCHSGLQLGRVTHGVLHHAACPVAVVPNLPDLDQDTHHPVPVRAHAVDLSEDENTGRKADERHGEMKPDFFGAQYAPETRAAAEQSKSPRRVRVRFGARHHQELSSPTSGAHHDLCAR